MEVNQHENTVIENLTGELFQRLFINELPFASSKYLIMSRKILKSERILKTTREEMAFQGGFITNLIFERPRYF